MKKFFLLLFLLLTTHNIIAQNCYETFNRSLLNDYSKLINKTNQHFRIKNGKNGKGTYYLQIPFFYLRLSHKDTEITVDLLRQNFFCLLQDKKRTKPNLIFKINNDTIIETKLFRNNLYIKLTKEDYYQELVKKCLQIEPEAIFEFESNFSNNFWYIKNKELYVLKESKDNDNHYIFKEMESKKYLRELNDERLKIIFSFQWVEVIAY